MFYKINQQWNKIEFFFKQQNRDPKVSVLLFVFQGYALYQRQIALLDAAVWNLMEFFDLHAYFTL